MTAVLLGRGGNISTISSRQRRWVVTMRYQNSRRAYSHFSSSIPSSGACTLSVKVCTMSVTGIHAYKAAIHMSHLLFSVLLQVPHTFTRTHAPMMSKIHRGVGRRIHDAGPRVEKTESVGGGYRTLSTVLNCCMSFKKGDVAGCPYPGCFGHQRTMPKAQKT